MGPPRPLKRAYSRSILYAMPAKFHRNQPLIKALDFGKSHTQAEKMFTGKVDITTR